MYFKNIPCKVTYKVKKKGLERSPNDVGFIPNLNINAKNLSFIVSGNRYACARLSLRTHAESCMHRLILACA